MWVRSKKCLCRVLCVTSAKFDKVFSSVAPWSDILAWPYRGGLALGFWNALLSKKALMSSQCEGGSTLFSRVLQSRCWWEEYVWPFSIFFLVDVSASENPYIVCVTYNQLHFSILYKYDQFYAKAYKWHFLVGISSMFYITAACIHIR